VASPAALAARDADETINITPAVDFIPQLQPGSTVTSDITVRNQTTIDADFTIGLFDATTSKDGSTALSLVRIGDAPRGAGAWLDVVDGGACPPRDTHASCFHLAHGEQRVVHVRIRVPEDAGAGGHYAGVQVIGSQSDPATNLDIKVLDEVPVFLTVAGDYERDLRVHATPDDPWRWHGGSTSWTVQLRNEGDVHENVSGFLTVDPLLVGTHRIALKPGILLPGEHRTQHLRMDVRDAPDLLAARVRVELDDHAPARDDVRRTVVLPWWFLVLVAVAIAVVWWRLRTRATAPRRGESQDVDGWEDPFPPAT
jgi:hypothetical protein